MRRYIFKAAFDFLNSLINPSPEEERERELETSVDEEAGDIDDKSDVALDGNDQLDLDLNYTWSSMTTTQVSDLLSDSEDRAGSAEEFQWSPTLSEQALIIL